MAVRDGSGEQVSAVLLHRSANVDQVNHNGFTHFMVAVANGHPDIVRVLLNKGANASLVAEDGLTALHLSAKFGACVHVTKMLVEAGADTGAMSAVFGTPLHVAAEDGR